MPDFVTPESRDRHLQWLLELTQLPAAAGREWRVIEWIRRWVAERPVLKLTEDRAGNLVIAPARKSKRPSSSPIYITAHLDHPAFVVERVIGPGTIELAFRGGVNDPYFENARIIVHIGNNGPGDPRPLCRCGATITGSGDGVLGPDGARLFKTYVAELDQRPDDASDDAASVDLRIGDVATWELPPAEVDARGIVHTNACDDLAAAAAALSAYDVLMNPPSTLSGKPRAEDVRLLFTRSEEIGFTGAIAACMLKTMPKSARVIALENSRSFPDSPLGGGPIVRVGDRLSIFDPRLTAACAKRAEEIAGHAATPTATQRASDVSGWKWQRKLMAGGACEATVFCAYGYSATCLCLPLGNYHNMADLAAVQDGTYDRAKLGPPRVGREFIAATDYHGLIDLLIAIGRSLPHGDPVLPRIHQLYQKHQSVLKELEVKRASKTNPSRKPGKNRAKPAKPRRKPPTKRFASSRPQ